MYRVYFLLILFTLSFSCFSQKKNSKLSIAEVGGYYGIKSGKKNIIQPIFSEVRIEENGLIAVKDTLGKWGYYDSKGREVISPKFIEVLPFQDGKAQVKKEDGWGIIDPYGKFLLKPHYKKIEQKDKDSYLAQPFFDVYVFKASKDTVASFLTDSVTKLSNELYGYFLDGKSGLVDTAGNKISLPLYDTIGQFYGNIAIVSREEKWGIIDSYGKEVISAYFDSAVIDSSGYIRVKMTKEKEDHWILFDGRGNQVTESGYSFIDRANPESFFIYKKQNAFGLMDISGKEIHPPIFNSFRNYKDVYIIKTETGEGVMNKNGKWDYLPNADSISMLPKKYLIYSEKKSHHFLDPTGKELYCTSDKLIPLSDGLVGTSDKGKFGRIDFKGKEILLPVYDSISALGKDSALIVYKDKQIGLYYLKRDTIIGPDDRIQQIFTPSEDFYGVKIKGKYGFIDGLGRIRISNRYDGVGSFQEGYAPVKLLGKWGFVDKAEMLRVQPAFDNVSAFQNGIAIVERDGQYGLINKSGNIVTPFNYEKIERINNGYFISYKRNSKKEQLKGLINPDGKEMIYAKYEELRMNSDGNVIVKKNNKYGVVSNQDLIMLSFVYDKIEYDNYSKYYITLKQRASEVVKLAQK